MSPPNREVRSDFSPASGSAQPVPRPATTGGPKGNPRTATSQDLQAQLEAHRSLNVVGITDQHHRAHQFAAMDQWVAFEIVVGIAFEYRIGRKIQLGDQGIVSWSRDRKMH